GGRQQPRRAREGAMGLFDRLQSELSARDKAEGLSMADVLALPDTQRQLCNWLIRQGGASLPDLLARFNQDEAATQEALALLVEQAFVQESTVDGVRRYKMRLSARRRQQVPLNIWQALDAKVEK
ncbi:MAG: hypothetical protein NTZ05_11730, partial [Chloroflexi bacterium]|nr:hypothetical protein [Chloroflexota bacterium]